MINDKTEQQEIENALKLLDQEEQEQQQPQQQQPQQPQPQPQPQQDRAVPYQELLTLEELPLIRLPSEATICETCPNAIWLASIEEVRCYCQIMQIMIWKTSEPETLILCDGIFQNSESSE